MAHTDTMTLKKMIGVVLVGMLLCGAFYTTASAHNGEDHSDDDQSSVTEDMSVSEMEEMLGLLKQIVALLNTLNTLKAQTPTPAPSTYTSPVEMETHHDEHAHDTEAGEDTADDTTEDDAPKLVIEIEPHNGQTHVHVRYVDKPEEMFFVTAPLTDEDGIVASIASRTGLDADTVQAALKYMQ